jgi:hypothetical protein
MTFLCSTRREKGAFLEVKSSASYTRRWVLQKKYASPETDPIPLEKRFVCCVDLAVLEGQPRVYVFPAAIVAKGLRYYFGGHFPNSSSYHLSLDFKPQRLAKELGVQKVGEHIVADSYLEKYDAIGVQAISG